MRAWWILIVLVAACDSGARPDEPVPEIAQQPVSQVPLAFALVVNAQEIVAGNSDFETDENARYTGIYPGLRAVLDEHPLAARVPAGTEALVITHHHDGARILARGPISVVTPALFDQNDAKGRIGANLTAAVTLALAHLSRIDAQRRVLFVIGDTQSTEYTKRPTFAALREYAAELDVETTIMLRQLNCFGGAAWDGRDGWFADLFTTMRFGAERDFVTMFDDAVHAR